MTTSQINLMFANGYSSYSSHSLEFTLNISVFLLWGHSPPVTNGRSVYEPRRNFQWPNFDSGSFKIVVPLKLYKKLEITVCVFETHDKHRCLNC